jgi:hypothetical protein
MLVLNSRDLPTINRNLKALLITKLPEKVLIVTDEIRQSAACFENIPMCMYLLPQPECL